MTRIAKFWLMSWRVLLSTSLKYLGNNYCNMKIWVEFKLLLRLGLDNLFCLLMGYSHWRTLSDKLLLIYYIYSSSQPCKLFQNTLWHLLELAGISLLAILGIVLSGVMMECPHLSSITKVSMVVIPIHWSMNLFKKETH